MRLSAGARLGPYEILAPLGAGGMGEVYRARDPRMGREVAIKISAERFSDRFEREVRAVAALNHPNICQVYDVGPNYLVMELVEGPTLAERIKGGALALEEALPIARQITDALEVAHQKGIVHRDLKPANIKIKPDGTVKVLDFGLAKMAEQTVAAVSPEESPTATMGATIAGQIMGTAAYMAPEQARGKTIDKRADIWAFGVVLYEMLTGRRLFEGETISDTLAAVLAKEPAWDRVPARAQHLLQSCLEKDPKRRLRDIADAWRLLDGAPLPAVKTRTPWIAAGILTVALAMALWAPWRVVRPVETAPRPVRLELDLGADVSLGSSIGPATIVSPDGSSLVFVSKGADGMHRLFIRRLDDSKAVQLPGTEAAYSPFFSPDGQWIGFFAPGKLKKTRIDGGEPIPLCNAAAGRGATWTEDGNIIAALGPQSALSQIPAEGGTPLPITELSPGELSHRWPQVLPGGKAALFTATTDYAYHENAAIAIVDLKDHHRKVLLEHAGMYPRYLPSGHLVYVAKGMLFAVPFVPERLELRGNPIPLQEVASDTAIGAGQIDFSASGVFVYRSGVTEGLRTLQWLYSTGKMEPLGTEPAVYLSPRLSPDGSRLAFTLSQGSLTDLWVYDFERGSKVRVTNGTTFSSYPVWSPDGHYLVFQSAGGMFWARSDAAGGPQPLTQSRNLQQPDSFTPDGTRLVFSELSPQAGADIRTIPVDSSSGRLRAGEPQVFVKTTALSTWVALSQDGRWLAYADAPAGVYEVHVRAFPDKGTDVQISNAGGVMPMWSRNGHELFYRTEDQRIMVVNYNVRGDSFVPEKPRMWFGKQLVNIGLAANLDLAPDGKRFIVLMPAETGVPRLAPGHVMLTVNFFDEVRRRLAGQAK
jgi:serine/threonine-protein kinase